MDEPFAGVDPLAVADIQDIIRKLKNLERNFRDSRVSWF